MAQISKHIFLKLNQYYVNHLVEESALKFTTPSFLSGQLRKVFSIILFEKS